MGILPSRLKERQEPQYLHENPILRQRLPDVHPANLQRVQPSRRRQPIDPEVRRDKREHQPGCHVHLYTKHDVILIARTRIKNELTFLTSAIMESSI